VRSHAIPADLAHPSSVEALCVQIKVRGLTIDLLVNNTGLGKAGTFTDLSFDVQADMVRLNVNTHMQLTHLFLPGMRQRQEGGVISVGSTASFQAVPHMAVYGATKAFVLSFSEALAAELSAADVHDMALCPGATATGFQQGSGV
jgi:short-subunit dehydrogenase